MALANGPASTHTVLGLLELNEIGQEDCAFIDFSAEGLERALYTLVARHALLAERKAAARSASVLRYRIGENETS